MWFGLLAAALAVAGPKKAVEVPLDVGVGPAAHLISGPVQQDQLVHTGLAISIEAVLDKKTIRKFKKRIPQQYRSAALSMDEIRISHPLIPDTIWLSPAGVVGDTGIYGVGLRPVGVGVPLLRDGVRLDVGAGLRLTYLYIHSKNLPSPTHFLRPGLDAKAEMEIPFSDTVLVSFGWDSQFYPPQALGGSILELGTLEDSIWHVGQAFLKFHYRIPLSIKP